jgi:dihydroneopterin aldolase
LVLLSARCLGEPYVAPHGRFTLLYGERETEFSFIFRNPRSKRLNLAGQVDASFNSLRRRLLPHSECLDDRIQIEGLEAFALIGVPDEERAAAQRLTFNLTIWPARQMQNLNDSIDRAVNYAAVCDEVRRFVEPRRDKLIETMANALAVHLLEVFEIRRITIELRKYIMPEVEFVSVTVTRERSDK